MNFDIPIITLFTTIFGFVGVIFSQFVRSPKETHLDHETRIRKLELSDTGGFDHEARIRDLEKHVSGSFPLWNDKHERYETAIEDLTIAVNSLKSQMERSVEIQHEVSERLLNLERAGMMWSVK
jgi:hypothetical protein